MKTATPYDLSVPMSPEARRVLKRANSKMRNRQLIARLGNSLKDNKLRVAAALTLIASQSPAPVHAAAKADCEIDTVQANAWQSITLRAAFDPLNDEALDPALCSQVAPSIATDHVWQLRTGDEVFTRTDALPNNGFRSSAEDFDRASELVDTAKYAIIDSAKKDGTLIFQAQDPLGVTYVGLANKDRELTVFRPAKLRTQQESPRSSFGDPRVADFPAPSQQ